MSPRAFLAALLGVLLWTGRAGGVVISEIHYHPPAGDEALEFVELANDSSTPEDLSGYAFVEGIFFEIPAGTVLDGRGTIVICADADAVRARYGITNAIGSFTGRLDNAGERLTLVNHAGIPVQSLRYRERGKWPVAPDGTGHTLVLRNVHLDAAEPESWEQSPELGGSPGAPNFESDEPQVVERVVVDRGEDWRYAKGTGPFSTPVDAWVAPAFNDGGWLEGPSGFGFGDGDDATELLDMQGLYTSVACRKRFTISAEDLALEGDFFLGVDFDDGFCAYLNGVEVAGENCNPAGAAPAWNEVATTSREAGSESLYPVPRAALREGENVLAIAGLNLSVSSTDFSLIPRLLHRALVGSTRVIDEPLVDRGEVWKFARGTAPFSSPAAAWHGPAFSDASWAAGQAGFGYREVGGAVAAYVVPEGTIGNQDFGGPLGMDFSVNQDVVVTRLGVFDSGGDGLLTPITARLYDASTFSEVASLVFTPPSPGELAGGSRFKDLAAPLTLPAGFSGTIVAEGYNGAEPNGNQGLSPLSLTTNDGNGALSFLGGGRFGMTGGQYPDSVDGGPENRYAAGTFEYLPPGSGGGAVVAPAGVNTLLDDMKGSYGAVAFRKTFPLDLDALDESAQVFLALDWDDGFCAWVNGVEVARAACGPAGSEPLSTSLASAARAAGGEEQFPVPREVLADGTNLLAIAALNVARDDADFKLTPRLFSRRVIGGGAGGARGLALNELFRGGAPGAGWVEIHNRGAAAVDLSGHVLTDDPARADPYHLPPGGSVAGGGFLVVTEAQSGLALSALEVQLFLLAPDGTAVTAATFAHAPPPDLAPGAHSECRFPDGGPLEWVTATPTRGARNQVQRLDTVVINEIFYHPPEERPGEFIELHNRGAAAADLSGFSFTDGIDFTFPGGASIAPGGYLVLAREPGVLLQNHGVSALGPYAGALSNKGENLRLVDRRGNPVDEVRYFEGGRWSLWADGRGSSLELIDPRADNAFATAWEASDESGKAEWENLSFQVANYVPAPASELHLYLVERGECLIDDVSIRRGAGANLIPNAGFESSTTGWIIGGTHVRSARTTSDRHGGVACLQVVASGKGDTLVNRIEAETSPALTAGAYDVSLWARWQRGTSLLIVHGEYSAGPYRVTPCFTCGTPEPNLSGNPLSAGLRMTIPLDLGTPGAENGARARLRAATGSTNLGPVIGAVAQNPPLPDANESVAVTARVADADGVAQVQIFHRTGSAAGAFQSSPLADDGLHGDGESGDGVYGGGLPGYASGNKVVFYIEAADGLGATRRFPAQAPASTLLYLVSPAAPAGLDACRVLLDDQRTSELSTRELHSNDLVHGAFVFGSEKVYYNTGTRYRGSPWGRPSRQSLRVDFPRDDRFHRGRRDLNISKTGGGPGEGTALHLIGRNAIPGKPSPTTDYQWGRVWLNTSAMGVKGLVETIGGDFLERWYGEDAGNGPLLKAFGRFVFNDSGGLVGQSGWEGASFIYRAENPENYRGYYVHSVDQTEDDWAPLFELTRTLDRTQTPDAAFAQQVGGIVDFDAFFRVLGSRIMVTDCDGFGINNGHNGYIAYNSSTGLWGYVAFDVECSYVSGAPDLVGSADPGIQRLLTHPTSRRAYFRILSEYVNGYWTAAAAGPWLGAVQRATGYSTSGVLGQINAVGPRVRSLVAPFQSLPFRIVTNSGNDMTVSTATVALEGEAPIAVETIFWRRGDGEFEALSPAWTTPGRWQAIFPLPEERNELTFIGFDSRGSVVGSTDIIVTTTFRPAITLASLTPAQGPASGGTRVTVRGGGFIEGMLVRFGGVEATDVALTSAAELQATTPAAPVPLPPGGVVDVDVQYAAAAASLPRAFTYSLEGLFIRGNANGDGVVDVSDAVRVLRFLFGGPAGALGCVKSADADDSGAVNITDALRLLNALFLGGPAPPAPYPACGFDLTADGLDCEVPPGCGA